jgi:hypothetical protein
VPWHIAVVQLDVLAYVRRDSSTAEAAAEVLQPGIRNQLQVRTCCMLRHCLTRRLYLQLLRPIKC